MKLNIGSMFANRAFLTPDLEACIGEGYRYCYGEMNQRINQFSNRLLSSNITAGDRIAILAKNNEQVLTEQDIMVLCRQNLAGFKCIKEIRFIDEVPRNTLGKVLKRSLRDQTV